MKHLLSISVITIISFVFVLPVFAQDDAPSESTPEVTPESTEEAEATCFVITEEERTIQVRVGPGENRTSVTFLPVDEEILVLGQTEDDDDNLWYQVDKETAAPNRAINEAWVSADHEALETIGDCEDIDTAAAPPIIPIMTIPTPSSDDAEEVSESDDAEAVISNDGAIPSGGTWIINWAGTTNVSCVGTGNVAVPSSEIFGPVGVGLLPASSLVVNITRPNAEAPFMFMFTPMYPQGNGSYRGEVTFFDSDGTFLPAVISVTSASSTQMSGNMRVNVDDCSGTVTFTASLG